MPKRMLRDWTDSHRVNALSSNAERLFTRLIMKADDYGCYTADPSLIRPSCFPLLLNRVREADISRWIAECEKAGLIALYQDASKPLMVIRGYGQRLKNSRRHFAAPPENIQFNDIPGTSGNFPSEEKRREEEEKRGAALPRVLDVHSFRKAWDGWLAYRKKRKKEVSDEAAERQLAKLASWGVSAAIASINTSIENDWQGLFPPRDLPKAGESPDDLSDDYDATDILDDLGDKP